MRMIRLTLIAIASIWTHAAVLAAEPFPQKPLRAIVPFAPGGATDIVMRLIAVKLADALGQPVVVDNRPGGGTVLATSQAAQAPADGHTLLVVTAAFAANPSLQAKLPYDSLKDFAPVTQTFGAPNILVTSNSLPVSSVRELVAYAKANPRKISYGSAGVGTSNHLAGEMFRTMAGIDIVHVPYKGDVPAVTDLLGGQIQMMFTSLAPVEQHLKAGRLKALGVSSSRTFSLLPDLPTVASGGVPDFEASLWNGIVVPSGTPAIVVERLNAEIVRALAQPDVQERIRALGFESVGSTPAAFGGFIRREIERSARVVREANIRVE